MKKQTKKTTLKAKKSPVKPQIKLIDGKYSHKFLVRLEPEEGDYLEKLKTLLRSKTFSGTVISAIMRFEDMKREIETLRTERYRLNNQLNYERDKVGNLATALKAILEDKLSDRDEEEEEEEPEDEG